MSLSLKISEIQARGEEALRNNDGQAALDLLAANLQAIIWVLERYDNTIQCFPDSEKARQRVCDMFGVKP